MSGARDFSTQRLLAVARKEALQLRRDPRSLLMAFVLPVLLVVLFGYAISFDVNDVPTAVLDRDGTARSRALVDAFRETGYFSIRRHLTDEREMAPLLDRGVVRLVLVIPRGFAADLAAGRTAPVQALIDGADANTASIALNYAQSAAAAFGGSAALRPPAGAEVRVWYNESLKSQYSIVPGLIAVIMMIIAAMLTSLTIAREWERGTMEQLAATPVHPVEVVLGKLLPYLGIGLFDVCVVVALGLIVFGVPLRGSPGLLFGASLLFLLGGLGLGIFISAVVRTQLLATQIAILVTYLPGFLLSGFAFDIANMPAALRALSLAVPARYFLVVVRGIFLKGVGPPVLWPQLLALAAFAVIGLTLAVRSFRKEIV